MSKYPSVGALVMAAGRRAIEAFVNSGECDFCVLGHDSRHTADCPFDGMSREDLMHLLAVLDATES